MKAQCIAVLLLACASTTARAESICSLISAADVEQFFAQQPINQKSDRENSCIYSSKDGDLLRVRLDVGDAGAWDTEQKDDALLALIKAKSPNAEGLRLQLIELEKEKAVYWKDLLKSENGRGIGRLGVHLIFTDAAVPDSFISSDHKRIYAYCRTGFLIIETPSTDDESRILSIAWSVMDAYDGQGRSARCSFG